jgi:Cys-tRNA synthase (O-phospho-L-seryl-tRNA:Cys-tRNA synthase)
VKAKFRQVDVTRALRAAKAAGMPISRVEIDAQGKIVIVSDVAHITTHVAPGRVALERWKAEQNGTAK